jgi:hypothetical protein
MTLAEIQRSFAEALYTPLTGANNLKRRTREGKSMRAHAESVVRPNSRLTALERVHIYSKSYWFRLLDSLYDDFPGVAAILGLRSFTRLSEAYLGELPSRSFSLRNLGSRLEAWLREHPEFAGRHLDIALDMTRLEWAHIEAYDSASLAPLGPEDLIEPGPHLKFGLQPHVALLALNYPVDDLRIAVNESAEVHDSASNTSVERHQRTVRRFRRLKPKRIHLAVHRFEDTVYYRRLDPEEYLVLDALRRGLPLGEAIDAALEKSAIPEDRIAPTVREWFESWSNLGLFCKTEQS